MVTRDKDPLWIKIVGFGFIFIIIGFCGGLIYNEERQNKLEMEVDRRIEVVMAHIAGSDHLMTTEDKLSFLKFINSDSYIQEGEDLSLRLIPRDDENVEVWLGVSTSSHKGRIIVKPRRKIGVYPISLLESYENK